MVRPMPRPPPAARMVATMVTTAIHRAHGCGGAGTGGGAYAGGGIQPSGAAGGVGIRSRDCVSNSDIGSTPIFLWFACSTTMPQAYLRTIRGSLEFSGRDYLAPTHAVGRSASPSEVG